MFCIQLNYYFFSAVTTTVNLRKIKGPIEGLWSVPITVYLSMFKMILQFFSYTRIPGKTYVTPTLSLEILFDGMSDRLVITKF